MTETQTDELGGPEGPSAEDGFDPVERQLCPDESCIGIIAPDGRCKVCGKQAAEGSSSSGPVPAPDQTAEAAPDEPPTPEASEAAPSGDEGEFAGRQLCPDGACIGVIGPDGRCKVCGQNLEPGLAPGPKKL